MLHCYQCQGKASIFLFGGPDFSESYGYMQYLLGDVVLYITLMVLLTCAGRNAICISYAYE